MQPEREKSSLDLLLGGTDKQIMSCSATYEKKLKGKYLTLKDCDQMLAKSITEVNNAIDEHSLATKLLAVAKIIKMVCDVIIQLGSSVPGSGIIIDKAYGGATLIVDATTGQLGQKNIMFLLAQNKAQVADLIFEHYGKTAVASHIVKSIEILYELYEFCTSGNIGGGEGLVSARNTVTRQIGKIRGQIGLVEVEMKKCGLTVPA